MFSQFARWLRPSSDRQAAHRLYIALVAQARQPFFYARWSVPDSVDGRFDLILLHVFLFTHRLRSEQAREMHHLAGAITDIFFDDMDRSLREMGVGDMSVGKKIKVMANAFNGRFMAYANALSDAEAFSFALTRNVYRNAKPDDAQVQALTHYAMAAWDGLNKQPAASLIQGEMAWPAFASV